MRIKLAVELIIFVLSIITFFLLLRRPYQYLHPGIRNICKENLNKKHFTLGQTLEKMPLGNIPYKLDLCITIVTFKLYCITDDIDIFLNNMLEASTMNTFYLQNLFHIYNRPP